MSAFARILAVCAALLPLSACVISVNDFGDYWQKGFVDERMVGKWQKVSSRPGEDNEPASITTDHDGGNLIICEHENIRRKCDHERALRTFRAGVYRFVADKDVKSGHGDMMRYDIDGDIMTLRIPKGLHDMAARKDPEKSNLSVDGDTGLRIEKLDANAISLLAEIPNNQDYWVVDSVLQRIR